VPLSRTETGPQAPVPSVIPPCVIAPTKLARPTNGAVAGVGAAPASGGARHFRLQSRRAARCGQRGQDEQSLRAPHPAIASAEICAEA
jgi:hypothetical protein